MKCTRGAQQFWSGGAREKEGGRWSRVANAPFLLTIVIVLSHCEWEEIRDIQLMLPTLQNKSYVFGLIGYGLFLPARDG